ncbi:MAG: class I adenylate-forming enzyme family protein [Dehalococcoidia bacterium]
MGKASIGLLGGYWPDDVFRYVAVPYWSLDVELVEQPAQRWGQQPALAAGETVVTYGQLLQNTERVTAGLQARLEQGARIELALGSPISLVTALLGALAGGYVVHLMDPRTAASQAAQARAEFKPDLLLCDEATKDRAPDQSSGVAIAVYEELLSTDAEKQAVSLDTDAPPVFLAGPGGALVPHSHHSLLAAALSWSTFAAIEAGQAVLCCRAAHAWDGLSWALACLFKGALCLFANLDDPSLPEAIRRYRPAYAALDLEGIELALADPTLTRAIGDTLAGVFVPVDGPFSPQWRRRVRNRLGVDVLTVYGSAELGMVLASHPSWYVDAAIGLPVTNVDLWPLDPATKEALDVSWDAIEYAEIGVKSPMIAPAIAESGDQWVPTGLIATMDVNGFYYLLERPGEWLEHLGLAIPILDRPAQWLRRLASALPFPRRGRPLA